MKRNVKLTIDKLKELRVELKLTQEQFAAKIGKSVYTVQAIECGRLAISTKFEIEVKLFLEHSEYFDLIDKYLLK
jgi:transcriptional regulator with XRE-family HTH domain